MNQLTLSIRVNEKDKKNFELFCNEAGMNVSTAINLFIKTVIREQKIPFEIKSNHYENHIYEKLKEAEKEMEKNPKRYTLEEVFESVQQIIDK